MCALQGKVWFIKPELVTGQGAIGYDWQCYQALIILVVTCDMTEAVA
jgi:hypothetical protein